MARTGEWEEIAFRRMGGSRGLREDLSEITRSLARQLRAAADFLAPPPPPLPTNPSLASSSSLPGNRSAAAGLSVTRAPSAASPVSPSARAIVGVRSDLAEIGGGFRTGLAALSSLLGNSPEKDSRDGGDRRRISDGDRAPRVVGITEEVLKFVDFLSGRPEEWIQCPVPLDGHFEISDPRRKHIAAVERLVPGLASLRARLCPSHISEGTFWKIYLFLLHPKLGDHDSELLSTPKIVEEMDRALQDLRNRIIRRLEISRADDASPPAIGRTCEIEEVDESPATAAAAAANPETTSWVNSIERGDVEQWLEDVEVISRKQPESEEEPLLSDFESDLHILGLRRPMSSSSVEVVPFSTAAAAAYSSAEWAPPAGRRRRPKPTPQSRWEPKADGESSDWVDAGDSDSTLG
ncbi:unnamed protein product [Spirodela intermedia]|uniref:BSD domain-containing protein n=1 Tax=Spirodela intermedia TaxID=51605 RepID=A0A7I8LBU4_SPIIN|nr:unnamed protein product [Spirodela intermedia]